jgi:hypothetical protein
MSYLIAPKVGVMELTVESQTGPLTVRKAESLRCNNTLAPGSSVKIHLAIMQMTELLCWEQSLAMVYLLVVLAQDQLFYIRNKGLLDIRQMKQRWLRGEHGYEQQYYISLVLIAGTLHQAGVSGVSG